jgi:hypothetical protein
MPADSVGGVCLQSNKGSRNFWFPKFGTKMFELVRNSKKIKFGTQQHPKISKKMSKISRKTRSFAASGGKKSSLFGGGPRVWHMGPEMRPQLSAVVIIGEKLN